jgi:hypothetical protein
MARSQAAQRRSLLAALGPVLLAGAASAAQPGTSDSFNAYVARGYREIATFAATKVDSPAAAAHFQQRAALVAAGGLVEPEAPDQSKLDPRVLSEARAARSQLVARLDHGARLNQPLLAAIAQVNFDCWVVPLPQRAGEPDNSDCRRKFYVAYSRLRAATPVAAAAPSVASPPPVLRPTPLTATPLPANPVPSSSAEVVVADPPARGCGAAVAGDCAVVQATAVADSTPLTGLFDSGHDVGSIRNAGGSVAKPASGGGTTGSAAGRLSDATGGGSSAGSSSGTTGVGNASAGLGAGIAASASGGTNSGAGSGSSSLSGSVGAVVGGAVGAVGNTVGAVGNVVGAVGNTVGNVVGGTVGGVAGVVAGAVGSRGAAAGAVGGRGAPGRQ